MITRSFSHAVTLNNKVVFVGNRKECLRYYKAMSKGCASNNPYKWWLSTNRQIGDIIA